MFVHPAYLAIAALELNLFIKTMDIGLVVSTKTLALVVHFLLVVHQFAQRVERDITVIQRLHFVHPVPQTHSIPTLAVVG